MKPEEYPCETSCKYTNVVTGIFWKSDFKTFTSMFEQTILLNLRNMEISWE